MKRCHALAYAFILAATASSSAHAQEVPEEYDDASEAAATAPIAANASAEVDVYDDAPAAAPKTSVAAAPPRARKERVVGYVRREVNADLMVLGGFLTTTAYGFSAIAAVGSPVRADEKLFIPVAGPWMDLAERPGCGRSFSRPRCKTEELNQGLLVASGAVQSLGVLLLLGSVLFPKSEIVMRTAAAPVTIAPVVAAERVGVAAAGPLSF